ncbi:MAG: DegT/DnrJ/EryC1/StrS family aminotransferase [Ignavibacteriaceae bacterium]|nr:DegT/DnrJ/EryC1/StrS family aminotransferase [Ignavibacteriaceae bacterium]
MSEKFIPVCEPYLAGNEIKYVLDALETGWISSAGKYITQFEEAFANYCGVKHGIAVANGTVALHLALVALGVGKDDEIIIPNFTMIATAFAVCYTGAKPVFVDAEKETWNIDVNKIESKITKKTKAILPVHIYGHPCDMEEINRMALKYNLKVLEDSAEVHGAEYKGKKCGSLGNIAAFSFFANKIATTGEGGMVVTDDDELAEKCRYFKNLCFPVKGPRNYQHNEIGFNYRMSNLHAALGLAQVEKLDFYVERRINHNRLYRKYLQGVHGIIFPMEEVDTKSVYWMNGIVVDKESFGLNRNELMAKLKQDGIDTRLFFTGMHKQKALLQYGCKCKGNFSISEWLEENGMYLPSGSNLHQRQIELICSQIKKYSKAN